MRPRNLTETLSSCPKKLGNVSQNRSNDRNKILKKKPAQMPYPSIAGGVDITQ